MIESSKVRRGAAKLRDPEEYLKPERRGTSNVEIEEVSHFPKFLNDTRFNLCDRKVKKRRMRRMMIHALLKCLSSPPTLI